MGARTTLLTLSVITLSGGAYAGWSRSQSQPQTLLSLMESINNKLHVLENDNLDSTLRDVEKRLETLETSFRRLDTTFQDKLDKLERNLNSKDLKDELMVEKLTHKMRDILDTSYDRYSRRLGYSEERLEMSLKKAQMSIEGVLNRVEKQQEDIQADITESLTILEDLKAADDKLNHTHKAIQQHMQSLISPSRDELQRISGSLDHIGSRLNGSLGPRANLIDGPLATDTMSTIRVEINSESNKLASKMNNMYNEMWRRVASVESLIKELGRLNNATRLEVLEEVRALVPSDHKDFQAESQENFLEVAIEALERKLQKLGRNLDDRMDTFTARQDLVLNSCFEGRMFQGLESKLSEVLERIFDVLSEKIESSSNRTLSMDELITDLMELVKSQHSHLLRTVTHNTNMVITLTKNTSDANKQLHQDISFLADHFLEHHNEMGWISNINTSTHCENKTGSDIKRPPQVEPSTITEVKFIPLSTTELPVEITKRRYDVGVVKITNDNLVSLADNIRHIGEGTVDNSIMLVLRNISPNLTEAQIDAMLQVLNSSTSFDSLEAIVQNTEADSSELYDDKQTNIVEVNSAATTAFLSGENNNTQDNSSEELGIQNSEENMMTSELFLNKTKVTDVKDIDRAVFNKSHTKLPELSDELKEELRFYILLWKIKNKNINTTMLRVKLQNASKSDEWTAKILPDLQTLCFGQNVKDDFEFTNLDSAMKSRLQIIKEISNNSAIYQEIENICNAITDFKHGISNVKITDNL